MPVICTYVICAYVICLALRLSILYTSPIIRRQPARSLVSQYTSGQVTPILRDCLHWLRTPQRIEFFKVALLVYKALNNLSPDYIASNCNQVSPTNVDPNFGLQTRTFSSCLKLRSSSTNDHLLL